MPAELAKPSPGTTPMTKWPVIQKSIFLPEAFLSNSAVSQTRGRKNELRNGRRGPSLDLPVVHPSSRMGISEAFTLTIDWEMSEGLSFYGAIGRTLGGNQYVQSKSRVWCAVSWSLMSVSPPWTGFLSAISVMKKKALLINEVSAEAWLRQRKLAAAGALFSLYMKRH